nr:RagB/SusD family nutrient uptake outer membrane protein [Pseudopedobacter sp.]
MKTKHYLFFLLLLQILPSCKDFLEVKPNKALLVPTQLNDFELLLNDDITMNVSNSLGILSDDDHTLNDAAYAALRTPLEKNSYVWASDIFEGGSTSNWNTPYQQIFNANVVLDGLAKYQEKPEEKLQKKRLMAAAYFYRAWALFHTAAVFAPQYVANTAAQLPGVPVYTKADVNLRPGRGTLEATYQQILADLAMAKIDAPVVTGYLTRPNKAAVFALNARVYMAMADYAKAKIAVDSCLAYQRTLMDYNSISAFSSRPFTRTNVEVIFQNRIISQSSFTATTTLIDSNLYRSYASNDLRKVIYFKNGTGGVNFKGSYDGTTNLFAGLTVDEMYLDQAECEARAGNTSAAMKTLNQLLIKRFKANTFIPLQAASADDALKIILTERRKELLFRGLRWLDLKRLNLESAFATTLTRKINGTTFTLAPNDKKYVLPIPDNEIALGGLSPNDR